MPCAYAAVLTGLCLGGGGVRNANRHECSRGRPLIHGQHMGKDTGPQRHY